MGFRLRRSRSNMDQRFSHSPIKVVVILEFLMILWGWNPYIMFSSSFFCYASKDVLSSSLSSSPFSHTSRKTTKPTTVLNANSPIVPGTRSNRHRIAAWIPFESFRSTRQQRRSVNRQLIPYAGYYTPRFPTTESRSNSFFSRKPQKTESDGGDESDCQAKKKRFEESAVRKGIVSVLGDFRYGVNCVHKDFLGLSWKVYSKTVLFTAPFVVLLFIILPTWSSSSSPTLNVLASNIQGVLTRSFEVLAEGARTFFVRPVYALTRWIISWCSPVGTTAASKSAWDVGSSSRKLLLWAILIGPIVEELVFRLAFRSFWKVLFRPIAIGSNISSGEGRDSGDRQEEGIERITNPVLGTPRKALLDLLVSLSLIDSKRPRYTYRYWRIASGIFFAIAHLPNYFPINPSKYTNDGDIRLPLLQLFPGDFASQTINKEYCLTSVALIGAIYQAMHCFINTLLLYGPLLDSTFGSGSKNSKHGGIFAAIGAHAAWNANAIWLSTNIKLRLFLKLVALPLFQYAQQTKKNKQDGPESSKSR